MLQCVGNHAAEGQDVTETTKKMIIVGAVLLGILAMALSYLFAPDRSEEQARRRAIADGVKQAEATP